VYNLSCGPAVNFRFVLQLVVQQIRRMSQQVELEPDQLERMQIVPGTDSVRQR